MFSNKCMKVLKTDTVLFAYILQSSLLQQNLLIYFYCSLKYNKTNVVKYLQRLTETDDRVKYIQCMTILPIPLYISKAVTKSALRARQNYQQ